MSKRQQISSWVGMIDNSISKVLVSDYCYSCLFTGEKKTKTLIVFPEQLGPKGIISIDKSIDKVELFDIIKLYKRIKSN